MVAAPPSLVASPVSLSSIASCAICLEELHQQLWKNSGALRRHPHRQRSSGAVGPGRRQLNERGSYHVMPDEPARTGRETESC
ncbi:hypothetical protein SLA2020_408550 [Shorea laevis]